MKKLPIWEMELKMSGTLTFSNGLALITGGGTGIGHAVASRFVEAGVRVLITGLPGDKPALERTCATFGPLASYRISDVTDTAHHAEFVAEVEANVGPIDCLINNAGRHLKKSMTETSKTDLDLMIETNLSGLFMLTSECAKRMITRKRGSVVMMSSMSAIMGLTNVPVYSLTKTALLGLTRSLASDLGPYGIRVNAVCPGFIDTPMFRRAVQADPMRLERITGRICLRDLGQPSQIGDACVFLCSDQARYITGVALPVDGGFSIGF